MASELKLDSFQFNDFSLGPNQMLQASLRMFIDCGFIDEFHIDYEVNTRQTRIDYIFDVFAAVEFLCSILTNWNGLS